MTMKRSLAEAGSRRRVSGHPRLGPVLGLSPAGDTDSTEHRQRQVRRHSDGEPAGCFQLSQQLTDKLRRGLTH